VRTPIAVPQVSENAPDTARGVWLKGVDDLCGGIIPCSPQQENYVLAWIDYFQAYAVRLAADQGTLVDIATGKVNLSDSISASAVKLHLVDSGHNFLKNFQAVAGVTLEGVLDIMFTPKKGGTPTTVSVPISLTLPNGR
jgi:hypothetical protein